MDVYILLGVGVATLCVGLAGLIYTKLLKKRMKRFVFRYQKIEKHFDREKGSE